MTPRRRFVALHAFVASSLLPSVAFAHGQSEEPPPTTAVAPPVEEKKPEEIVVTSDDAPSQSIHARRKELELRPRLRPGDILEAVPGLFAVQHAGGGKANQYFLRGFDADHGTDVGFFVDGVPVNMVSHGHGQGYSDFNFLIPELVVGLDAYKGPYYAQFGDFATAGAVNLRLAESFDESYAQFSVGQYGILRGLVIESPHFGDDWHTVLAAETYRDNGPFQSPEDLTRFNLFGRVTHDFDARSSLSLTWMSYGSQWNGSGQIPARAVCGEGEAGVSPPSAFGQPCIDHFGTVDPSEGGATQRHMASISYSTVWPDADLTAMLYLIKYRFSLYSNFTFFKEDPIRGDEIEQNDDRVVSGFDLRVRKHAHIGAMQATTSFGLQARNDAIENGLHHDEARVRLEDKVLANIAETAIGVFAEEDFKLTSFLRFVVGLRADRIDVDVDDKLTHGSGVRGATRISPKWMAVVSPLRELDLFLDYGRGFHSNDARGSVLRSNAASLMTTAAGYEIGARLRPLKNLSLTAAAFLLDLDSELVWSGDEGTTEPSGATRRYGLEFGGRYHVKSWLFADVDATFTHAAFRTNAGNGQAVALAPRRTLTAGIGVRPKLGELTPFGSIRLKAIADRPANEDGSLTANGFTIVDVNAGIRWKNVELAVDVQNLLGAKWREVNFATDSRLRYEPAAVTGIHYSPGWPRTAIGRTTVYW